MLWVCEHTVCTPSLMLPSAWLDRSCWWSSRLEFFLGGGWNRQFSTFLSIALTHTGMEIHGSHCNPTIVWAVEYDHVGQAGLIAVVRTWVDFSEHENLPKSFLFASGAHRRTFSKLIIVPVESTAVVYFRKVIVELSIVATLDWGDRKYGHFRTKRNRNFTFHLLTHGVTAS